MEFPQPSPVRQLKLLGDVNAVFHSAAGLHPEDGEVGAVDEALGTEPIQNLLHDPIVGVGGEVPDGLS